MVWVKLDDRWPEHPKTVQVGDRAAFLFVSGLCYCARNRRDGFIPEGIVSQLTPARNAGRLAEKLVVAGLWERVDGGFQVHDYGDYQPRWATEDERAATRDRVAKHRAKKREGNDDVTAVTGGVKQAPRARTRAPGVGSGELPPTTESPPLDATLVDDVEGVLRQSERLFVDRMGIENAIGAWPGRDALQAARTVVTWVTDPAFRSTNAAKLLGDALSKQEQQRQKAELRDAVGKGRRSADARVQELLAEAEEFERQEAAR